MRKAKRGSSVQAIIGAIEVFLFIINSLYAGAVELDHVRSPLQILEVRAHVLENLQ
jgi:hypothetical protein